MHILDTIVQQKKKEVSALKELHSLEKLIASLDTDIAVTSLKASIMAAPHGGIISEFKKKSPSKKNINLKSKISEVVAGYNQAGVAGISVLTDASFFGGHTQDLEAALAITKVPVLRKEFIIDPYQIYQSKALGAHAILLIARILTPEEIKTFTQLAQELNLEVLVEIHNQKELDKCPPNIDIIGVNNRDLDTFKVNYENSIQLKDQLPEDLCKISESGISDTDTMVRLREEGFDGFLIGEMFMATADPGVACQMFLKEYKDKMELR